MSVAPVLDAGQRQRRRVAIAVVATLVTVFLAASIAAQLGDITRFDWTFEPLWLGLSLAALVAFYVIQALLWVWLVRAAGGALPARPGTRIFSLALLTRYVPTQILMAVTRVTMLGRRGVSRSVAIASLAYEFPLLVGSAFVLSVAFLIDLPALEGQPWRWAVLAAPALLLAALHPRVIGTLVDQVAARLGGASEHLAIPPRRLALFAVAYLASFVVAGLGVYAFARSIYPPAPLDLRVISSYAIGYSAAVLAFFIPGGLGARDGATATALAAVMPGRVAVAVAIGIRLAQTLIELGAAGALELWHRRREARAC
jgi:glycosyltransferase 2 family protein